MTFLFWMPVVCISKSFSNYEYRISHPDRGSQTPHDLGQYLLTFPFSLAHHCNLFLHHAHGFSSSQQILHWSHFLPTILSFSHGHCPFSGLHIPEFTVPFSGWDGIITKLNSSNKLPVQVRYLQKLSLLPVFTMYLVISH